MFVLLAKVVQNFDSLLHIPISRKGSWIVLVGYRLFGYMFASVL